jgi:hypothetical protein
MKPATVLTFVVVVLIAVLHVLRLIFHVTLQIGGAVVPVWPSAIATIFFTTLAVGLWREHRSPSPAG